MIPRFIGKPCERLFGRITNAFQRLTPSAPGSLRYPNPPTWDDVVWVVIVAAAVALDVVAVVVAVRTF